MKFSIFVALCTLLLTRSAEQSNTKSLLNIEEGDGGSGDPLIKVIEKVDRNIPDDTESSGEEDDETDLEGSGSGSGSGVDPSGGDNATATVSPTFKIDISVKTTQRVVVINTGDGTTAITTTSDKVATKKKEDEDSPSLVTTMGNSVEVGVDDTTFFNGTNNDVLDIKRAESQDPNKPVNDGTENSGVNFTVAIIVGVVVGAILSILIIVFLVYRLRKKDEGSYSLDEPSSAMLRADTDSPPPKGKGEYFA